MQRIEFDIKYRADIEAGRYKVETRDGRPARIVCWDVDMKSKPSGTIKPILSLHKEDDGELAKYHFDNGKIWLDDDDNYDLFLVPAVPETYTVPGWVARDSSSALYFHPNKPRRKSYDYGIEDEDASFWDSGINKLFIGDGAFPSLTWNDEPIEVTLTIKRKEESK